MGLGQKHINVMTKEDLFVLLKDRLKSSSCLSSFYIGVSNDVIRREQEHRYEKGYDRTIMIAHSNSEKIANLEKFLIDKFLQSELSEKVANKKEGGGNVNQSTYLYVSIHYTPQTIEDLDEEDFDWNCVEYK